MTEQDIKNISYETDLTADQQVALIKALDRFAVAVAVKGAEVQQHVKDVRERISDHTVLAGDLMMSLTVMTLNYETLRRIGLEVDPAVLEPMLPTRWRSVEGE